MGSGEKEDIPQTKKIEGTPPMAISTRRSHTAVLDIDHCGFAAMRAGRETKIRFFGRAERVDGSIGFKCCSSCLASKSRDANDQKVRNWKLYHDAVTDQVVFEET